MQEWYNEHIVAPTRRELFIIVCPGDEIKRASKGIITNNTISHVTHNNQQQRHSRRSSSGVPAERLPRLTRRQDATDEEDDGHLSLLQSKSDSKLRCLTTKRKHNIDLRATKSETLHLNKPFVYPNNMTKLDYIIKSFESIEVKDDYTTDQYRKSLNILSETDANESYVSINNLKQFKETCLLYNVTYIK